MSSKSEKKKKKKEKKEKKVKKSKSDGNDNIRDKVLQLLQGAKTVKSSDQVSKTDEVLNSLNSIQNTTTSSSQPTWLDDPLEGEADEHQNKINQHLISVDRAMAISKLKNTKSVNDVSDDDFLSSLLSDPVDNKIEYDTSSNSNDLTTDELAIAETIEATGHKTQTEIEFETLSYDELKQKFNQSKEIQRVDHSKINYRPIYKNNWQSSGNSNANANTNSVLIRGKNHNNISPIYSLMDLGKWPSFLYNNLDKYSAMSSNLSTFPIQTWAIPALCSGRDVIGVAPTGSGKTLAYAIPAIRHVQFNIEQFAKNHNNNNDYTYSNGPRVLVLSPTRELAIQIHKLFTFLTRSSSLKIAAAIGGSPVNSQAATIRQGVDIIIGTPGRVTDILTMSGGKITNLVNLSLFILDECDRMFDVGFEPQIAAIGRNSNPKKQVALFSATFPSHLKTVAKRCTYNPIEVVINSDENFGTGVIKQFPIICVSPNEKILHLLKILGDWSLLGSIIIFTNEIDGVDKLYTTLLEYGYSSYATHSDHAVEDRDFTIEDFRNGVKYEQNNESIKRLIRPNILITTSICARGLDIPHVISVINYDAPKHLEDYLHRIGRCGRGGRVGFTYTFIVEDDVDDEAISVDLLETIQSSLKMSKSMTGMFDTISRSADSEEHLSRLKNLAKKYTDKVNAGIVRRRKKWSGYAHTHGISNWGDSSDFQKTRKIFKTAQRIMNDAVADENPEGSADVFIPPPPPGTSTGQQSVISSQQNAQSLANQQVALFGGDAKKVAAAYENQLALNTKKTTANLFITANNLPKMNLTTSGTSHIPPGYVKGEIEINNYPEVARSQMCARQTLAEVEEISGNDTRCRIRGQYVPKNTAVPPGAKKLYVEVVCPDQITLSSALYHTKKAIEDLAKATLKIPGIVDKMLR